MVRELGLKKSAQCFILNLKGLLSVKMQAMNSATGVMMVTSAGKDRPVTDR